ncbi:class I SAM-dependent methyltransferase [Acetobacter farinalis]|uniref:Class I SAM-dependent methyltransferase n=1 Tax=Acetobacter farinalis TaxID=1260984 RepID=A0ABT3Q511_9PROT|nr:class I SAM-dependent methyltransferase [Acetobacter farinalis]MCX2560370.1 class I SAM-dependent methyltransferase [Acetobacter farinalis]NHO29025.1 methyltransferase domain-containing protein [Acetobacter farinalis]
MTDHTSPDARDTGLAAQYEAYPYPERNPQDEHRRLLIGSPSHLREIDYWVFGAQRPRSTPLRALVAGCGTGDGAIMLATQMAREGRAGEVVCLDRSSHALSIARARAEARELGNIRFVEGSLTELETLALGHFDYIDCCGVLHHLPDPKAALDGLTSILAPGGGMGLMVYAPYGRTGVYMLQEALEQLAPCDEPPATRLDMAKRVMRHLPATAWLRQNGNFGDHLSGGDAGLYDLLLNPRDRAYTIGAFLDLLDGAGLETTCLMEPARYDPALFLPDPKVRARIAHLPLREQASLAESLSGNMATHVVYVTRKGRKPTPPDASSFEAVPVMREIPGVELAKQMRADHTLPFAFGTLVVPVPLPAQARGLLPLIDGSRTVGDLAAILATRGVPDTKFRTIWQETFHTLERLNRVLLLPPA